ncbi:GAF domain-containing protein [Aureimonas leprariae]|uniref:Blue-light-activated histidine kinase n=1 Tax=Plantimonas leprariae TaxID=2615207 RepID=A0A7V7PKG2_9HYPH|nr:GAF domain-containing protein [Aureimonas leprariae]KAB0676290.1 GAF domain-containing protein [Aureimonas leprariae]
MTTHDPVLGRDERLGALHGYRVLDTPPERGFDDVVTLATQLCDMPVALVSLVDRRRQWFKARVGFEPCETDLDSSVCRHALGTAEILEIDDLTADPRTRDNPLVTGEPYIRFYAGAPLNTAEGLTLGTLCVIDTVPRPGGLTAPQRVGLRALANQVMAQLDLRRAVTQRDDSMREREADRQVALTEAARLETMIATQQAVAAAEADLGSVFQAVVDGALRVVDAADGAVVELRDGDDLVYDTVSGTSARHKGIRLPVGRTLSGKAVLAERPMHCADTEADPSMNHALAIGLGIRSMVVVPVTRRGEPIGALKVQSAKADAFSPRDVVMMQMLAGLVASAVSDVAEVKSQRALRQAEVRYRQTFESVTEFGVVVTDRDGTVTDWNAGAERIFGWTAEEIRGTDAERFFTPEDRAIDRIGAEMRASLRGGSAVDERWHLRKDGSRFYASGNMMPLRDDDGEHLGFIKIVRDRTEQHLAGLQLDETRRALEGSEAKWRGLFQNLQEGFVLGRVVRDADGRIVDWRYEEVNRAWADLVGIEPTTVVGRTVREVIPGVEDEWVNEFADVVKTGTAIRFTRQVGSLQRWYDGVAQAVGGDRFTVIFLETTERVLAERRREALRELGDALLDLDDPDAISGAAAAILGRALGVGWVGYGVVEADGETFVVPADWTADGYPSLAGTYRMDDYGGYAEDLRQGRTVVIPDIRLDPRTAGNTGPLEGVAVRSLVNLPIVERGRTVAILYVNDDHPREWTDAEVEFLRDAAGRTRAGVERRRAAKALAESQAVTVASETKWRSLFETLQEGFGLGTVVRDAGGRIVDWRYDEVNAAWGRLVGVDAGSLVGRTVREVFPGIEDEWVEGLGGVVDTGEARPFTGRVGILGRFYEGVAQPRGPETFTTIFVDVTERVERERRQDALLRLGDALRTLTDRQAITEAAAECLASGIEASRTGFASFDGTTDVADVLADRCAPGVPSVVGRHRLRDFGTHVDALKAGGTIAVDDVGTDPRTASGVGALRAIKVEAFLNLPVIDRGEFAALVFVNQDRPYAWSRDELEFVRQVGDRAQAAVARIAAEERRVLMNQELAHRLKNNLALVSSIVTQTLRSAPDMGSARKTLSDRIQTLSKAHDVLMTGRRDAAAVREVIRSAVTLHDDGDRLRLKGPKVGLGPRAALTLALICHELATNAGKYGALSAAGGHVDVSWSVAADPETRRPVLTFEWREVGGPPVTPPDRKSFGTRLIEMGLSGTTGGTAALDYASDGLRCRITASLAELQAEDEIEARD